MSGDAWLTIWLTVVIASGVILAHLLVGATQAAIAGLVWFCKEWREAHAMQLEGKRAQWEREAREREAKQERH